MKRNIINFSPSEYTQHFIHTRERDWAETNCYVDVWIELLNALNHNPIAAMAFTLSIDFEGDQWTFFKFPLQDLRTLFGIEVQELAVWKPVLDHAQQQLDLGRAFIVELDSKYLPDTQGTAYQTEHVKTSVAITGLDIENKKLEYFHAQGYYQLSDKDFDDIFRLNVKQDNAYLPPYIEIAKFVRDTPLNDKDLLETSKTTLIRELNQLPKHNPFFAFKKQLQKDIEWLTTESMEVFHAYSFATLRQFGACYELASLYLLWLNEQGENNLQGIIEDFQFLSENAKIYQFQLARAMSRKKPLDLSTIDLMAEKWQQAMDKLKNLYL